MEQSAIEEAMIILSDSLTIWPGQQDKEGSKEDVDEEGSKEDVDEGTEEGTEEEEGI